jgi:hypothetical protein
MRFILLTLAALLMAMPAVAQPMLAWTDVVGVYVGANGQWYDQELYPSDVEVGGSAKASLSPHISLVGESFYGLAESYLRGAAGFRITATDIENRDFSIGIGACYHVSSSPALRPEEWAGDVTIGYRPWPADMPAMILLARGVYGFETEQASALVGLRVEIGGKP